MYSPAVATPMGHSAMCSFECFGEEVRLVDLYLEVVFVEFFPNDLVVNIWGTIFYHYDNMFNFTFKVFEMHNRKI